MTVALVAGLVLAACGYLHRDDPDDVEVVHLLGEEVLPRWRLPVS